MIRILAWIHVVLSGLVLLGGLALVIGLAWGPQNAESRTALQFVGPLYLLIAFSVLPEFIGGLGLLARRRWARCVIVAVSVLYLFAFPVGTALGAFGLWALLAPAAARRFDATLPESAVRPAPRRNGRLTLLPVIAGVGGTIAIALAIAFRLNRHPRPSAGPVFGPDGLALPVYQPPPAIAGGSGLLPGPSLLIGFAALAIVVPPVVQTIRRRRALWRRNRAFAQNNAGRIAELEADPIRRGYAARIAKGERWSDAQIAYDLDINAVATCMHLQPVERAMRHAGIAVRFTRALVVEARCRVDAAALERRSLLVPPAIYREYFATERSREDNPTAAFSCQLCSASSIFVIHPMDAGPETTGFGG